MLISMRKPGIYPLVACWYAAIVCVSADAWAHDTSSTPTAMEKISEEAMRTDSSSYAIQDASEETPVDSLIDSLPPIESMPEVVQFVKADYPADLVRQGIEGVVRLEVLIDDSGMVDSVALIQGIHPMLDSNATAALRAFRFTPAKAGGEPVPVIIEYAYEYRIDEIVEKIDEYVNFSGRLLERGTRAPVGDAMVVLTFLDTNADTSLTVPFSAYIEKIGSFEGQYLEEGKLVTISDANGEFSFSSLPAGLVAVRIPVTGYEDFVDTVGIAQGEATEATMWLHRLSYADYEIVVYGKAEKKEVARRTLSIGEVKKVPGFGGDAVKVVQALPGVSRPVFGFGEIIVRGTPTWDSRFYVDGMLLDQLYHFGGIKSTYNSDALATVDLFPGGFNTRYGGCIGGVIEITGRPAKKDRWHGYADMSFIDGSFMVEGPVAENLSVLATARRSFIGEVIRNAVETIGLDLPMTVAPYYWDYIARADYTPSKEHSLYTTAFGSQDRMEIIVKQVRGGSEEVDENTNQARMKDRFHIGIAGWDWNPDGMVANSLRGSVKDIYSAASIFGFAKFDVNGLEYSLRDELAFEFSDRYTLKAGCDLLLSPLDITLIIPQSEGVVTMDTIHETYGVIGAYCNLEWEPVTDLRIIPGLRYDYFPELIHEGAVIPEFWEYHDFQDLRGISAEPSARLTGRYEYREGHVLKGAVGNYSQSPQPIGQCIHEIWGDPTLPTTKAAHYVLGYEWQLTDLVRADLQGYVNRQWHIPRMAEAADIARDPDTRLYISDVEGRMKGLELMLRHDQGKTFFGWLAYTLSRSERRSPVSEGWELFGSDQTHNLQLVGNWRLPKDWEIGGRLRYVTGNPTTPVIGSKWSNDYDAYMPIRGAPGSERMDPFVQLDIRIDKKYVFKTWMLATYVDVQNVNYFIYNSPEFYNYNYNYTERKTVGSIIIPSVGTRIDF